VLESCFDKKMWVAILLRKRDWLTANGEFVIININSIPNCSSVFIDAILDYPVGLFK
jgi:hypothetical protein